MDCQLVASYFTVKSTDIFYSSLVNFIDVLSECSFTILHTCSQYDNRFHLVCGLRLCSYFKAYKGIQPCFIAIFLRVRLSL